MERRVCETMVSGKSMVAFVSSSVCGGGGRAAGGLQGRQRSVHPKEDAVDVDRKRPPVRREVPRRTAELDARACHTCVEKRNVQTTEGSYRGGYRHLAVGRFPDVAAREYTADLGSHVRPPIIHTNHKHRG